MTKLLSTSGEHFLTRQPNSPAPLNYSIFQEVNPWALALYFPDPRFPRVENHLQRGFLSAYRSVISDSLCSNQGRTLTVFAVSLT